jgi:group I intron endonuclease
MRAVKHQSCFVYMATSPTGRSYIGVSVDPQRRWQHHQLAAKRGSELAFHRAIRKHGAENFKHQVIFEASGINSQAICFRAERTLIEFNETLHPNGYNLLMGGDTGSGYSKQTAEKHRQKIIEAVSKPEIRQKMSVAAKKRMNSNDARNDVSKKLKLYYEQNPDARLQMSQRAKILFDRDHQTKMTQAAIHAMKQPEEAKRRAECARKVATDPKVRAAINAVIAKPVLCVETGQSFNSVSEAVRWVQSSINPKAQNTKICQAASGKIKTAYGYSWLYAKKL